jgi:4'-phosphopantetheinyl transferase
MNETPTIDQSIWLRPPSRLELIPPLVDVWIAHLNVSETLIQTLGTSLSADEHERAARFHFAKDRNHYIAGRGMLRSILGGYLNVGASELRFRYNGYGKPYLADDLKFEKLQFNVAHSHGLALYAVTIGREIGIDIERVREDFVTEELAERFFAPEEVKALTSLPPAEQRAAFFECWTRKEAFIKARAMGLSLPLDQFVVAFGPGIRPALVSAKDDSLAGANWLMRELRPANGYVGALVIESGESQLRFWKFDTEDRNGSNTQGYPRPNRSSG